MNQPDTAAASNKATLRSHALARRNALSADERARACEMIAERVGGILAALSPDTVALYKPIGSECETHSLMERARAMGAAIGLPAIVDETTIEFRGYRPGDRLVSGGFGTRAPTADAPLIQPDVIIVPVVGFDRTGVRLGYGRGHYDRAITTLRQAGRNPTLIGIAFAVQEVERIPAEPHDVRLDWVVTEKETLHLRNGKD